MSRKGMTLNEFNKFMKRCSDHWKVRYVTPTIHPRAKHIVSIVIDTGDKSEKLTITNNPDENFDLNKEVNNFLDKL